MKKRVCGKIGIASALAAMLFAGIGCQSGNGTDITQRPEQDAASLVNQRVTVSGQLNRGKGDQWYVVDKFHRPWMVRFDAKHPAAAADLGKDVRVVGDMKMQRQKLDESGNPVD